MYTAAVIGCGRIGTAFDDKEMGYVSTHAAAYQWHPNVKLVGVCDTDLEKLDTARYKFTTAGYIDYKEMIRYAKPDIVSICTPPETHAKILFDLVKMDAGIASILCEKPIAKTSSEAEKMVLICKKRKVNLLINHTRAFMPFYYQVHMYAHEGLGGITHLVGSYSGGIYNNGTHMLDLMCRFGGDAKRALGMSGRHKSGLVNDPNIDGVMVLGRDENEVTALLLSLGEPLFELDIHCKKGKIKLINGAFDSYDGWAANKKLDIPGDNGEREPMLCTIMNVVGNLDGQAKPFCSGEHGLAALKLAETLVESAKASVEFRRKR